LLDPHRLAGQDGGDGVLVDELRLPVPHKQKGIAVEPCHVAVELDPIRQKDREPGLRAGAGVSGRCPEALADGLEASFVSLANPLLP